MQSLSASLILIIFTLTILNAQSTHPERALVISGGGSFEPWGAGVAKYLIQDKGYNYQMLSGASAGAILLPFVALKDFDRLEKLYENFDVNDIFDVNPFNRKGKFRKLNAFFRLLMNKDSFGDTEKFPSYIRRYFSEDDFNALKKQGIELSCTVTSLTTGNVEAKSNFNYDYQKFTQWIAASGSFPIFLTSPKIEGEIWADGGIRDNTPIIQVLERGFQHIDVILLAVTQTNRKETINGIPEYASRVGKIFLENLSLTALEKDLFISKERGVFKPGTIINIYFMTPKAHDLVPNILVFDPKVLVELFDLGYKCAGDQSIPKLSLFMNKQGKIIVLESQNIDSTTLFN